MDHFREMHYMLHKKNELNIFSVTISGCIFLGGTYRNCGISQSKIEDLILEKIKRGDLVVISNSSIRNTQMIKTINDFAKEVEEKGGRLIVFSPIPTYEYPAVLCSRDWFRPFAYASCKKTLKDAQKEVKGFFSLTSGYLDKRILVYNPLLAICSKKYCSPLDPQSKPLYIDGRHLTDYASSEYIYPDFISFLNRNKVLTGRG
jgi:hypothetical protein